MLSLGLVERQLIWNGRNGPCSWQLVEDHCDPTTALRVSDIKLPWSDPPQPLGFADWGETVYV